MLSRVQSLGQLKILDKMDPAKIHVNEKVIAEAKRMLRVSINKKPCNWMNPKAAGLKVSSLNVNKNGSSQEDIMI